MSEEPPISNISPTEDPNTLVNPSKDMVSPGVPEIGDLPDVQPAGDYSRVGNGHTYELGDDGKASVISRDAYAAKHGIVAEPQAPETPSSSEQLDEFDVDDERVPDKKWTEMSDNEQYASLRSKTSSDLEIIKDVERDTWVIQPKVEDNSTGWQDGDPKWSEPEPAKVEDPTAGMRWDEMTDDQQYSRLKHNLQPGQEIIKDVERDTWVVQDKKPDNSTDWQSGDPEWSTDPKSGPETGTAPEVKAEDPDDIDALAKASGVLSDVASVEPAPAEDPDDIDALAKASGVLTDSTVAETTPEDADDIDALAKASGVLVDKTTPEGVPEDPDDIDALAKASGVLTDSSAPEAGTDKPESNITYNDILRGTIEDHDTLTDDQKHKALSRLAQLKSWDMDGDLPAAFDSEEMAITALLDDKTWQSVLEHAPEQYNSGAYLENFINDGHHEDKDIALGRLEILRRWGLEGELNEHALDDETAMELLLDDDYWTYIQSYAKFTGAFKPGEPAGLPAVVGGAPTPDVLLTRDTAPLIDEVIEAKVKNIPEMDSKLQTELDFARWNYVKIAAEQSGEGFSRGGELKKAKEEYDKALAAAGTWIGNLLKDAGVEQKRMDAFAKQGAIDELTLIDERIRLIQLSKAEGRKFAKFYDWWAKQDTGGSGFFGRIKESVRPKNWSKTLKKMAVMSPAAIVGFPLGVAGAAVLGPVIGGAAGMFVARGMSRGWMGARINKAAGTKAAIEAQSAQRMSTGLNNINWEFALRGRGGESVSNTIYEDVKDAKRANRFRMLGGVAAGAIAGAAGAAAGAVVGNVTGGGGGGANQANTGGAPRPEGDLPNLGGGDVPAPEAPADSITPGTGSVPQPEGDLPTLGGGDVPTDAVTPGTGGAPQPEGGLPTWPGAEEAAGTGGDVLTPLPEGLPANFESNMPYTNAVDVFQSPDWRGLVQRTLDEYNGRHGSNFVWEPDGMFHDGSHIIDPGELAEYNRIMAELVNQTSEGTS